METEYSIDEIFDGQLFFFAESKLSKRLKSIRDDARAKSEKAKNAYRLLVRPFVVTEQNAGTGLYYREIPLPW